MSRILKKLRVENYEDKSNSFLIPMPTTKERILIRFYDKKKDIHLSNYSFIDEETGRKGIRFFWNNYQNRVEKIKVTIIEESSYLLRLPQNLTVIAAYY